MNDELNKLKAEHSLLRTLIDNLPDAIYAKDLDARKTMANSADLLNLGCRTEAEVIGKTDYDFFPEEIASACYFDDQEVLKSGTAILNRQEQVILKNGEVRWLLTSKIPWRDENGEIIGLLGVGRDITSQIEAEVRLREQNSMLSALMDHMTEAVCAKDAAGCIMRVNPAGLKQLGLKNEADAIGKTDADFFPPDVAARFHADDQVVINTGIAILDREEKHLLPSGRIRWGVTARIPWRDSLGKVSGLICIRRDITK